jgi:protein SCO1/2
MNSISRCGIVLLFPACCLCPSQLPAKPDIFRQVGFDQRLDQQVPPGLRFRDHTGAYVSFGQYFGDKPIVLSLVYYECPMLCTLELNGLVRSLKVLESTAGDDFEVVVVSFDPGETPELAARKRQSYIAQYARKSAGDGWHFLTGDESNVQELCAAVGFRHVYDADRDEFAHPSGIVLLTPTGRVARYFYGIDYPAIDLRLGLVEASAGKIGSPTDHLLLLCYGYDPVTGKYGLLIMKLLRLAGVATVVVLGGFIGLMLYREGRARKRLDERSGTIPHSAAVKCGHRRVFL